MFEAVCAAICLVSFALWHATEEVWSMHHEACDIMMIQSDVLKSKITELDQICAAH